MSLVYKCVCICLMVILSSCHRLKSQVASKYGVSSQPRLVDIIAAVPQEYKKVLHINATLFLSTTYTGAFAKVEGKASENSFRGKSQFYVIL